LSYAEFSEEETALILKGVPFDQHSPTTQEKLIVIEWDYGPAILARNLLSLLPPGV